MLEIINATPHDVTIITDAYSTTIGKAGYEIRAESAPAIKTSVQGPGWHIPCVEKVHWVGLKNHNRPAKGRAVMVSIVAAPLMAEHRPDCLVLVPDTGPGSVVRNESGQIKGVRRLIIWHRPEVTGGIAEEIRITHPYFADKLENVDDKRESSKGGPDTVVADWMTAEDPPKPTGWKATGRTGADAILELDAMMHNCGQGGILGGENIRLTRGKCTMCDSPENDSDAACQWCGRIED